MNDKDHVEWVAGQVREQLVRLAPAEVAVPYRFSVYTRPDRQFPTLCYPRACYYVESHPIRGVRYVFGTALGGGLGGEHGWVELPGNVVFDGVLQRFYDREGYYRIEFAMPWYKYTRSAVVWLLEQRLPNWRWDWSLRLPWAKSAHDPTVEALVIDRRDAERYLAKARLGSRG